MEDLDEIDYQSEFEASDDDEIESGREQEAKRIINETLCTRRLLGDSLMAALFSAYLRMRPKQTCANTVEVTKIAKGWVEFVVVIELPSFGADTNDATGERIVYVDASVGIDRHGGEGVAAVSSESNRTRHVMETARNDNGHSILDARPFERGTDHKATDESGIHSEHLREQDSGEGSGQGGWSDFLPTVVHVGDICERWVARELELYTAAADKKILSSLQEASEHMWGWFTDVVALACRMYTLQSTQQSMDKDITNQRPSEHILFRIAKQILRHEEGSARKACTSDVGPLGIFAESSTAPSVSESKAYVQYVYRCFKPRIECAAGASTSQTQSGTPDHEDSRGMCVDSGSSGISTEYERIDNQEEKTGALHSTSAEEYTERRGSESSSVERCLEKDADRPGSDTTASAVVECMAYVRAILAAPSELSLHVTIHFLQTCVNTNRASSGGAIRMQYTTATSAGKAGPDNAPQIVCDEQKTIGIELGEDVSREAVSDTRVPRGNYECRRVQLGEFHSKKQRALVEDTVFVGDMMLESAARCSDATTRGSVVQLVKDMLNEIDADTRTRVFWSGLEGNMGKIEGLTCAATRLNQGSGDNDGGRKDDCDEVETTGLQIATAGIKDKLGGFYLAQWKECILGCGGDKIDNIQTPAVDLLHLTYIQQMCSRVLLLNFKSHVDVFDSEAAANSGERRISDASISATEISYRYESTSILLNLIASFCLAMQKERPIATFTQKQPYDIEKGSRLRLLHTALIKLEEAVQGADNIDLNVNGGKTTDEMHLKSFEYLLLLESVGRTKKHVLSCL
ncbi:hypothetical protein SARC_11725 [Sphaeroforma arctica JP610]|uniref:Uncharacterized protein n=1 Tax=Sphaeroforma arctica JP610 TaxID=667725 RepID=A0A0L0FI98_9EUKA|nr:hypothetical protein SARC_11725 [Sphaeroforma arctica JP610]KNC75758.1 hypothetical protein SARC_11725 [Sphaeroforma arctica JP610]|eukprot:XP_014149660.1 hypothetical protein SARC_11725 [Sphaeroforma arctica JP610]